MSAYTTTFTLLKAKLQSYCVNNSTEFQAEIDDIINKSEDKIRRELNLGIFVDQDDTDTTVASTETVSRPSGALSILSVQDTTNGNHLRRRSEDWCTLYDTANGIPLFFAERESTIRLSPTPGGAYSLVIRSKKIPTAIAETTNETNWYTDNVADILEFACLIEAQKWLKAPEFVPQFQEEYDRRMAGARVEFEGQEMVAYKPMQAAAGPN